MKIERVLMVAAVMGLMACHGNDKAVRKDQQYDVVQEGQASGVTSTINAPGETPPVTTAPLTGTGVDTTTAFNSTPGMMSTAPPMPPPRRVIQPHDESQSRPPRTDQTTTSDTTTSDEPKTDTTTTTEAPPPPPPPPPVTGSEL